MTPGPEQHNGAGGATARSRPDNQPRPGGEPLLAVKGLTIDLPGGAVQRGLVEDVTFDVHKGRAVALIGESGCGKSLTSMAILGLLPAAVGVVAGSVLFDGVDLLTCTKRQLRRIRGGPVGMVFQEPMSSLNPTMTVGDQIAEVRRLHLGERRSVALKQARELLERVGIPKAEKRLRSYPHEMSGGMQQRVMIAAAIACEPKLLIADEPTTALDVTVQAEVLALLNGLVSGRSMALLLIGHDLAVVAGVTDRLAVLERGSLVESGRAEDIVRAPRHPYTRALVESAEAFEAEFDRLAP